MTPAATRQATLAGLSTMSRREFEAIWRRLNLASPAGLAVPLAALLAEVADKYGAPAAALAAEWYDESRDEAGAPGRFEVELAALPDASRFEALARWGVTPLFGADPNPVAALTRISGGLQRIVLGQARETTFGAVASDPVRPQFARHASSNACAFCAMLATRGAVYASAASSLGDRYHDDCHCAVVEVFPGQRYEEAPYVAKWREAYSATSSGDTKTVLSEMRQTLGTN